MRSEFTSTLAEIDPEGGGYREDDMLGKGGSSKHRAQDDRAHAAY